MQVVMFMGHVVDLESDFRVSTAETSTHKQETQDDEDRQDQNSVDRSYFFSSIVLGVNAWGAQFNLGLEQPFVET